MDLFLTNSSNINEVLIINESPTTKPTFFSDELSLTSRQERSNSSMNLNKLNVLT